MLYLKRISGYKHEGITDHQCTMGITKHRLLFIESHISTNKYMAKIYLHCLIERKAAHLLM
jgi:hypothetical protein